ncbi:hypothetical protein JCM19232_5067 [Vibrio ishigakensis]|uniref:Uncharacterized protein n=1 Tax=Vibrio ishigakensis TaxID=1481914 RepID=A0A0B8NWD6_9VIBR|nr:hypothetical protein JCM19231_5191 [Vibrio ishigakensis]GAM62103.1 hypothetical protein JCM19232_5067 [Vibrio ishigakensis]
MEITITATQGEHTPKAISVNGTEAPFSLEANRYRTGGARISAEWLKNQLTDGDNKLLIKL